MRDILKKQTRMEKVREVVDMLNNAVTCLAAANNNNGNRPTSIFVGSPSNRMTSTAVENNTLTQSGYNIFCVSLKHYTKTIFIVTCLICYIYLQGSTAVEVFRV